MPTGYTSKIHDGKEVTAKEFIMDCSRAFGALIMMRDAPMDTPIPERFEPSMYAKEKAVELKNELARVQSLSEQEAMSEMESAYRKRADAEFAYYNNQSILADRYKKLIEQVEKWNPPTDDHRELKEFCLKQLNESLSFDCLRIDKPYVAPDKPILDKWLNERIDGLTQEIAYYEKSHREEVERTEKRNEWLKQLRDSLESF